jgi:enoyl-CoA hydratase/carnithine racemase
MRSGSAAELFYTGNVFDAKFMKKGGYLTEVFEHREEMEAYSDGFAMKITRKDRSLLAMMKKSFFHKGL